MYMSKVMLYWIAIVLLIVQNIKLRQDVKKLINKPTCEPKKPDQIKIITLNYKDKNYYLFDVLTSVGIMYDDKQRQGIENLMTKDKIDFGFKPKKADEVM